MYNPPRAVLGKHQVLGRGKPTFVEKKKKTDGALCCFAPWRKNLKRKESDSFDLYQLASLPQSPSQETIDNGEKKEYTQLGWCYLREI